MSASEWIVVPGAAGAAVVRTTDARQRALDLEEFDLERRTTNRWDAAPLDDERGRACISGFR
jgi:hypothetical protein